jgi:2-hydroxychromene-2-carboxylate isomerase
LLGALFKAIDTPNVPLFEMSKAKQSYMLRDLNDWAEWWDVDFSFPNTFPIRTVLALRVAIIEPAVTHHLYRAVWVEGHNIGDPETLRTILNTAGFDGEALIERTQDPSVKTALRDNTGRAEEVGACGVPTAALGNTLFWGQDRLHRMAEAL